MPEILLVNPVDSCLRKGRIILASFICTMFHREYTQCVIGNPLQSDPDFADVSHILEEKLHVCFTLPLLLLQE